MFDKKVEQASHRHNCHATSLSHKRRITLEFRMFQFIRIFAVGILLQGPMRSLGIKCYYNNNGLAFNQLLFDLKHKTLSLVPLALSCEESAETLFAHNSFLINILSRLPLSGLVCLYWVSSSGRHDQISEDIRQCLLLLIFMQM